MEYLKREYGNCLFDPKQERNNKVHMISVLNERLQQKYHQIFMSAKIRKKRKIEQYCLQFTNRLVGGYLIASRNFITKIALSRYRLRKYLMEVWLQGIQVCLLRYIDLD